jgi:hypothetical protein
MRTAAEFVPGYEASFWAGIAAATTAWLRPFPPRPTGIQGSLPIGLARHMSWKRPNIGSPYLAILAAVTGMAPATSTLNDNLDQKAELLLSTGHVITRLQRLCTPALTLIASLNSP